jgi:hypothetical protein
MKLALSREEESQCSFKEKTLHKGRPWKSLEPATRIERAACHRFVPEACLSDSYEGGQAPLYDPHEGDTSPSNPLQLAARLIGWLQAASRPGAGDWNRTSDLRFTNGDRNVLVTLGDASGFPLLASQGSRFVDSTASIRSISLGWVSRGCFFK